MSKWFCWSAACWEISDAVGPAVGTVPQPARPDAATQHANTAGRMCCSKSEPPIVPCGRASAVSQRNTLDGAFADLTGRPATEPGSFREALTNARQGVAFRIKNPITCL